MAVFSVTNFLNDLIQILHKARLSKASVFTRISRGGWQKRRDDATRELGAVAPTITSPPSAPELLCTVSTFKILKTYFGFFSQYDRRDET